MKPLRGLGGPILIVPVRKLRRGKQKLMGQWNSESREVLVKIGMNPDAMTLTIYHELVHSWLFDSGTANALTEAQQEAVCDAVALGLHHSGLVGKLTVHRQKA